MMAAVFDKTFIQNLQGRLIIRYCPEIVFSKDNLSNEITVKLYNGESEYSGGGTVSATVIRADGRTVPLTGTITGNVVSLALIESCMEVPGQIQIFIRLTSGNVKTTVFAGVFTAVRTETDTVIDPGTIIPSVTDLINQIDAAIDSIPADYSTLLGSVASTYSASKTYAVGDYVWYDGALYRCTTAISTAESWTAAHWSRTVLGDDVTGLKSAIGELDDLTTTDKDSVVDAINEVKNSINVLDDTVNGTESETITPTHLDAINIVTNGTTYVYNSAYETYYWPIEKGKQYEISIVNGTGSASYRFANSVSIPANGVAATFLQTISAAANETINFSYTATADGYLSTSYYEECLASISVSTASVEGIKDKLEEIEETLNGISGTENVTMVNGLNHRENDTTYVTGSNYKTWYVHVMSGCTYTFVVNADSRWSIGITCRVSFGSSIPANGVSAEYLEKFTVATSTTYTYTATSDGYIGISHYYDASGSGDISTIIATYNTEGMDSRITAVETAVTEIQTLEEQIETLNSNVYGESSPGITLSWEVGSIYRSDGTNYDENAYSIRSPSSVTIADAATIVCTNALIGTVYAFKYSGATYIERLGTTGVTTVELESGYSYRFVAFAADSTVVIDSSSIPTYSSGITVTLSGTGLIADVLELQTQMEAVQEETANSIKAVSVTVWEVGSIYGNNGTNYDENTHAVRTPNGSKIQLDSETTFVCENENIATVYAFKYDSSGTFVERYGSTNYKSVTIPAGYYRLVLVAVDNTVVITSATIEDYSEFSAFITGEMGKLTGELARQITVNKTIGTDFVIDSSFMKRGINVTEIGQISGAQAFCVYNGKYYSCSGSTLYRQDSSFTLETSASVTLGHGNALMLGSNGVAYASGWDNDTVYVVDLASMTVTDTIALPITGYTTAAVDDVNEIMYIFSRSDTTSTVDNWTFTVWDYASNNVLLTKKITNAFAAIQGVDFYNGRILVAWGLGTNVAPSGIAVYDTNGNMLNEYRATAITSNEPEGICFDRATNRLLFSTITQKVFEIEPTV